MQRMNVRPNVQAQYLDVRKAFGQTIAGFRAETGLSQARFGELCDLSSRQYGRLERGEANPTLKTMIAIQFAVRDRNEDVRLSCMLRQTEDLVDRKRARRDSSEDGKSSKLRDRKGSKPGHRKGSKPGG